MKNGSQMYPVNMHACAKIGSSWSSRLFVVHNRTLRYQTDGWTNIHSARIHTPFGRNGAKLTDSRYGYHARIRCSIQHRGSDRPLHSLSFVVRHFRDGHRNGNGFWIISSSTMHRNIYKCIVAIRRSTSCSTHHRQHLRERRYQSVILQAPMTSSNSNYYFW